MVGVLLGKRGIHRIIYCLKELLRQRRATEEVSILCFEEMRKLQNICGGFEKRWYCTVRWLFRNFQGHKAFKLCPHLGYGSV